MGLAKLIAVVFTKVLLNLNIAPLPDTLEQVQSCSLQALQKMRAMSGQQARASRIPPLVRTYKNRLKIKGRKSQLPQFAVFQRIKSDVLLVNQPAQWLPKGSKLLAIEHIPSNQAGGADGRNENPDVAVAGSSHGADWVDSGNLRAGNLHGAMRDNGNLHDTMFDNGFSILGAMHGDETADATRVNGESGVPQVCTNQTSVSHARQVDKISGDCLDLRGTGEMSNEEIQTQVWGTPWTPDEFVEMAEKQGIGRSSRRSCPRGSVNASGSVHSFHVRNAWHTGRRR